MHPLNCILFGAPGTGKTYATAEYALAFIENREVDLSKKSVEERKTVMDSYNAYLKKGQIVFTTFHQSYGYEDFIQGMRPDPNSDKLSFVYADGVFKKIADEARSDLENNYVIIIDEINRANISKVFGELITLIEEDKREGEVNAISVVLPSGAKFSVPNNLYIIGTMNSADKSISLIDTALRRRFDFVEVIPRAEFIENATLRNIMKKLNESLVSELDSTDLLIGHSYFMGKTEADICNIMNRNIIPLLYEYFYDNSKKVKALVETVTNGLGVAIKKEAMGRIKLEKQD
jgi:5-methylcytosine-specific restriction protein B